MEKEDEAAKFPDQTVRKVLPFSEIMRFVGGRHVRCHTPIRFNIDWSKCFNRSKDANNSYLMMGAFEINVI